MKKFPEMSHVNRLVSPGQSKIYSPLPLQFDEMLVIELISLSSTHTLPEVEFFLSMLKVFSLFSPLTIKYPYFEDEGCFIIVISFKFNGSSSKSCSNETLAVVFSLSSIVSSPSFV